MDWQRADSKSSAIVCCVRAGAAHLSDHSEQHQGIGASQNHGCGLRTNDSSSRHAAEPEPPTELPVRLCRSLCRCSCRLSVLPCSFTLRRRFLNSCTIFPRSSSLVSTRSSMSVVQRESLCASFHRFSRSSPPLTFAALPACFDSMRPSAFRIRSSLPVGSPR